MRLDFSRIPHPPRPPPSGASSALAGGRWRRKSRHVAATFESARDLLRRVSRSFYLSLRFLPADVRGPMSLAYLLARASDTLADSATASVEERRGALAAFGAAVQGTAEGARAPTLPVADPAEAELLARTPELLAWLASVPDAERALVRRVLAVIIEGQTEDLDRTTVASADELDRYTWQVAGCVGEFWTRLCALKQANFARSGGLEPLVADGIRFGKGLQLVNILRDVPKDAALGRSYLPGVAVDAPPGEKWRAAAPWADRCAGHLDAGRTYARSVRGVRQRFVVLLPLLLGEATLALVRAAGPAAMSAPVKVPRPQVKKLALRALVAAFRG